MDSVSTIRIKVSETSDPSIAGVDTVRIRDPFDLDIIEPASGVRIDSTISRIPSMPHLSSKAKVTGRKNSPVTYYWDFTLKWFHWNPIFEDSTGKRIGKEWVPLTAVWSDTLVVSGADTCRSSFQWGNDIRGGFIDTLTVTAKCRARSVTKSRNTSYRILGLNPSKSDVKDSISRRMQVILYKESKFCQFGSDSLPVFGSPAGYGVAMMDPPTSDQQFWSWKANRAAGVTKFAGCVSNAEDYGNRIRTGRYFKHWHYQNATDLDTNQQRLDAFQQYNGGHHWYWDPDRPRHRNTTGHWYENPHLNPGTGDANGYGRDAERIYQNILRGQYPSEWN